MWDAIPVGHKCCECTCCLNKGFHLASGEKQVSSGGRKWISATKLLTECLKVKTCFLNQLLTIFKLFGLCYMMDIPCFFVFCAFYQWFEVGGTPFGKSINIWIKMWCGVVCIFFYQKLQSNLNTPHQHSPNDANWLLIEYLGVQLQKNIVIYYVLRVWVWIWCANLFLFIFFVLI